MESTPMHQDEFVGFAKAAARRVDCPSGRIGNLVLTQHRDTKRFGAEPSVREPEMRHAFAQAAEEIGLYYAIEVPTRGTYRFTEVEGDREVSARHDIVLLADGRFDADRQVIIETKAERPALSAIYKDLNKLICETAVSGKCMLHILHAENAGTLGPLLDDYNQALVLALADACQRNGAIVDMNTNCWFELLVFITRRRGREHGNRPRLLRWAFPSWSATLQEVIQGEPVFCRQDSREVELD